MDARVPVEWIHTADDEPAATGVFVEWGEGR